MPISRCAIRRNLRRRATRRLQRLKPPIEERDGLIVRERSARKDRGFVKSACAVGDAPASEVVGGQFDGDLVTGKDTNEKLSHLARYVGQHPMTILKLDSKHGIGQRLNDRPFYNDGFFFCQNAINSLYFRPQRPASAV